MVWRCIVGVLYAGILTFAAIMDIRTHEIPDRAHLFLLALSIAAYIVGGITVQRAEIMVLGAAAAGGPLLAAALLSDGIGGGDVKLAASAGIILGWAYSMLALILSLFIFVVGALICRAAKRLKHHAFAMAPSIAAGFTATYALSILMKNQ